MKKMIIAITALLTLNLVTAGCDRDGNTGNGAVDTPVKHGSGVSDSAEGTFDTRFTPDQTKKQERQAPH